MLLYEGSMALLFHWFHTKGKPSIKESGFKSHHTDIEISLSEHLVDFDYYLSLLLIL